MSVSPAPVDRLTISVEDLTIEQIEMIEDVLDLPIDEVFSQKKRAKAFRAIAYAVRKSENPDYTWEMAGKVVLDMTTDETDPTEASEQ